VTGINPSHAEYFYKRFILVVTFEPILHILPSMSFLIGRHKIAIDDFLVQKQK